MLIVPPRVDTAVDRGVDETVTPQGGDDLIPTLLLDAALPLGGRDDFELLNFCLDRRAFGLREGSSSFDATRDTRSRNERALGIGGSHCWPRGLDGR